MTRVIGQAEMPLVSGVARSRIGAPVADAVVTVINRDTGDPATAYAETGLQTALSEVSTDGNGVFACYLPPGTYGFTFSDPTVMALEDVKVEGDVGGTTGGTAGALLAANNLNDLVNAATARDNLGLGALATAAATSVVSATGGGKETLETANVSGARTIDLANGNCFNHTLTGDTTYTFAGATAGVACSFLLILTQDGTGGRTVTWPGSVTWAGAEPTVTGTAGAVTIVEFLTTNGGVSWIGLP